MKFKFVWRKATRAHHWHVKTVTAPSLADAVAKVVDHLQTKLALAPGMAELDHYVQEVYPENGQQRALHTLTKCECPLQVVFENKSWPPGHFPR